MKKHILFLMLVILVFTGCQNRELAQTENQYGSTPAETDLTEAVPIETDLQTEQEETIYYETQPQLPAETQATKPTETEPVIPLETQATKPAEPEPTYPPATEPLPKETEPQQTEPTPAETEPQQPESLPTEPDPQQPESLPTEPEPPQSEPAPTEPEISGDIYSSTEAMAVGNAYAASTYGMSVDYSLGFSNASFEFADAAYVAGLKVLGGQSYLNEMVIQKIDSLAANLRGAYGAETDLSAYRVNCWVEYDDDGELYWIYVFYG